MIQNNKKFSSNYYLNLNKVSNYHPKISLKYYNNRI